MQIAFIGGGVMAEAIIGGIIESKIANAQDVHVGEPVEARRAHLENTYGLTAHANNRDALEDAGLSVLAVKPQSLPYVLPDLKGKLSKDNALLSIVAGATMKTLTDGLDHKAVIRVMPNTPAQIGAGMSVWTAAPEVSEDKRATTKQILGTLGEELYADDEKLIDMATALSASGPAYVFLFIEALIDAGVYLGMARDVALVVVHGNNCIVLAVYGLNKHRVRGDRSGGVNAHCSGFLNRWSDLFCFLIT